MVWQGFKDVQATIIIDLAKNLDELWKNLDKDARWGVNKAKKEGLSVSSIDSEEGWKYFYDIYRDTCKRGGVLPLNVEKIREKTNLLVCIKDNKIIAGAVVKEKQEKIELFLNASLVEFLNLQPNNLLYWGIIEYAKEKGFKIFDLGGYQLKAKKGMKLYEINRFKERWGGKITTYNIRSKNLFYILGRKLIRNFPKMKWIWDRIKGRPVSIKDRKLKELANKCQRAFKRD